MNSPSEWINAVLLVTHVTMFSILCKNVQMFKCFNVSLSKCSLSHSTRLPHTELDFLSGGKGDRRQSCARRKKKKLPWGQLWLDCWGFLHTHCNWQLATVAWLLGGFYTHTGTGNWGGFYSRPPAATGKLQSPLLSLHSENKLFTKLRNTD